MLIGISTIDLNWFYSLPRLQLVPLAILSMDISQIPWEEIPIPGYKHKRCPGISGINGDIFRCRYMFVRPLGILMSSVELQEISQIPWEDILMCGYKHKRCQGLSVAIWRYIPMQVHVRQTSGDSPVNNNWCNRLTILGSVWWIVNSNLIGCGSIPQRHKCFIYLWIMPVLDKD